MLHTRIFTFNPLGTNCIVLWADGSSTCAVVDPGMSSPDGLKELTDYFELQHLTPEVILLTHGHFDHVWGVEKLLAVYPVPVYLHPADKHIMEQITGGFPGMESFSFLRHEFPALDLSDGQELSFAGTSCKVLHTPGHTPGGVCYYFEADSLLVSGDTLFAGAIGRTDLAGGDYDVLMKSIQEKLLTLPSDTDVIPGHGHPTNILKEATTNPFLQPFNEPDSDWWNQDGIPISPQL